DLVRAEIGNRLNVISKEVAGLLEKAHNDNPDVTLLGLARSVQALVSPAETLQQIYLDVDNLVFVLAANEIMTYLNSLKVETEEGRAALMGMKGFTLLSLDRVADAEHMLLELLDMSQEIAKSDPKTGRGLVAAAHLWLGRLYSQTDRSSEAEAAFQKALKLGRSLVKSDPAMYIVGIPIELSYSATFLFLGSHIMALGRLSEAKQKLRKADRLMRTYFQKPDSERDDRFRHMVPYTQVRLALALFLSGDIPEAEELYRELVRTSKEPLNRASSLWNLGEILRTTDRMDEAERIAREVVEIHRTAKKEDVVYDEALALSLNNLASIFRMTGRQVEAQDAYREALGIMRGLVEKAPESYRLRTLAWTLCDLGALLTESGSFAEAEEMYQESLEISRKLVGQARERNLGRLSATLNNYAVLLSEDKQELPSERMLREALEILEQIVQDKPETVLLHDLVAAVLNNLGIILRSSKRASESLETLQRAHTIQSKLAEKAPQLFSRYLATVLNNLGIAHFENGSQSLAEEHIQKALEIWRELCQKAPDQYLVHITSALNNLAVVYDKKNDHQKAEEMREEAMTITNQLFQRGILLQARTRKIRNSIKNGVWLEEYREIVNPPTLG
ncbi:MAG: tetratricopeptide repeat protein, partial [Promethearchaeota archaeon]